MCIVGNLNGTRYRDGVKVLWCHSHVVWLVFEDSHPYMHFFSFRKLFVTCSYCFLLFFVLQERRGGRGGQGKDAWSIKYDNVHISVLPLIQWTREK